ncbi:acyl-CoA synthetase [Bradyrhizobium sp. NP1]|uniref:acyl-CoA synthetase n=1 Tax=Bradyrhizobium sp. NP1 TaxID=3049772 RepID=UPI0025A5DF3A|nr:acyl-CoA synthetase [Bradyrhizobium sp. NP1]WJR80908.1 acyl-CoA synthetase [Bradyrhizobium sp. NP1]
MTLVGATYQEVCANFRWEIPTEFNIAEVICDRHVGSNRTALLVETAGGRMAEMSFEHLQQRSRRLANALSSAGIAKGDRVGILLPQCPETLIVHLAAYRLGAIALPLFTLFGPDALEYRLNDSGAKAVVSNAAGIEKLLGIVDLLAAPPVLISIDERRDGRVLQWDAFLAAASADHTRVATAAEDPAIIVYTSGTTGNPKGVLYPHRTLLGHLPGVELPHDFFPRPGDRMWTPADWAWAGGLMDVLLPSLFHGVPVVAKRMQKFDPEEAFALISALDIRNAFMPPTALKMMRQVEAPQSKFRYAMRSIASGGERLGQEMLEWGQRTFGLTINEFYGQTEANLTVGNCASIMKLKDGSMGRAIPGHVLEVVDDDGRPVPPGTAGTIAVRTPDPVFFLRYWNKPDATREKFRNEWLLTGDTGHRDEEGYFWFHGRNDDVIISGGYRIGPTEIEDCLMRHPAVAMVAVIGVPDKVRGEVVKAFIVPREGFVMDDALHADVQAFVKSRLSAHEYPRQIEFRTELPLTITGKIRRMDLRKEPQAKS